MSAREWIRTAGAIVAVLGFMCLPRVDNAKWDTSLFFQLAKSGLFMNTGFTLILVGAAVFLISFIPTRRCRAERKSSNVDT